MSNRISRFMWPFFGAALLLAVLLAGCTGSSSGPAPVTTPATPAEAPPPATTVATTAETMTPVPQTSAPSATTMTTTPTTQASPPSPVSVTIKDFVFHPASVTVPAGTTVTWTNLDAATHSIVSDTGKFSSSNLPTGQTFSFTFTGAGSYPYHCGIHTTMHGTVTVT